MSRKLNYRLISKVYDLCELFFFCRKNRSPRQAVLSYIPENNVKILDVCAGTAINSVKIAENKPNANIVGIDISREMLSIADKKIARRKLYSLQMLEMDAANLDFDVNTFDVVVISLVLHEMGKPLRKKILSEAKRVLKPNGKILVIEWEKPIPLFQKLMFSIIKFLEANSFEYFLNIDFNEYFKDNGLIVKSIKHCDYTRIFELISLPV